MVIHQTTRYSSAVEGALSGFSLFAFRVLHATSERRDAHAMAGMLHTVARMPMDTDEWQELPPIERVAKAVIVYITVLLVVAVLLTLFMAVIVILHLVTGVAPPWLRPPLP